MKKSLSAVILVGGLVASGLVPACNFTYRTPGDNGPAIKQALADTVTEQFCQMFPKSDFMLFVWVDGYASQPSTALGYATVGIVKRGSKAFPSRTYSAYSFTMAGEATTGNAAMKAAEAVRVATKNLMSDLESNDKSQIQ